MTKLKLFPLIAAALMTASSPSQQQAQQTAQQNPFLTLMQRAAADAKHHNNLHVPALSPAYQTLLGPSPSVDVKALQAAGFLVVPWTVDDLPSMLQLIDLHVDGIISDRPDLLATALQQARDKAAGNPAQLAYLNTLDLQGHRGARGLRPENTLPAFEAGLDHGISSIETDTGVTSDHQSLIWHDQFLNPQSCRRSDGKPYTLENRVYIRDISMADAQSQFLCDKLHFGPDQKNDLALSPVSAAFASKEHMLSPYSPTHAAQLFRFVAFYTEWYATGPGQSTPDAAKRAHTGSKVHFNLETKILPPGFSEAKVAALAAGTTEDAARSSGRMPPSAFASGNTVPPEVFVDTLCGLIQAAHMEARSDVQSFDFRTLLLVQQKYPAIRTYYLTETPALLNSGFVPAALR